MNDLDLKLVHKPGTDNEVSHLPLRPVASGTLPQVPASVGEDHRNTVEQVTVKNAPAGHWQVQISNSKLALSPQAFTLIGEFLPASLGSCVPTESPDRLFDRIYRVDKSRSRMLGGSGLGLAICRQIVENHEGTITAENAGAGGLSIRMEFPLAP